MEIHQVKTPLANSYVVNHDGQLLVVDVGVGCHEFVVGFIEQKLGIDRSGVQLIICTHDDLDHIGGLRHMALACGAPFALPLASRSLRRKHLNDPTGWLLRFGTSVVEASRPRAWRMYGSPARRDRLARRPRTKIRLPPRQISKLRPIQRLQQGDRLPGFNDWEVIHSPGHTWDSCCYLHRPSKSLLSGDTLLGSASKRRVVLPSILSNRAQMRDTVRRLHDLKVESIYPGHGSVIHGQHLLDHLVR